jgi:UDP-glucose 4-epimerase
MFKGKTILITGGTGSFGNRILKRLKDKEAKEIRVFSRDEKKQYDMKLAYSDISNLKFFVGDIRDKSRLREVVQGVDIIYNAAALKQVPSCEECPEEAIKTNILGAKNIVDCAIEAGVSKVIAISTDKAVQPVNVMGMTKALQEKLMIAANNSPNNKSTLFSCVRYGNVMNSRGSVIPFFRELIKSKKKLAITHAEMTRFLLTLDDAIDLVFFATEHMQGGEIFVKKAPSIKIVDLARLLYIEQNGSEKGFEYTIIGTYPGEKIHEILISEEEGRRCVDKGDYFIITTDKARKLSHAKDYLRAEQPKVSEVVEYCSKDELTDIGEIKKLLKRADEATTQEYYTRQYS